LSVATYKPIGTPVSASGSEKFEYAGEMLVGAAGSSPGLYYIGARWMDPELGRWLSLDPELGKLSQLQALNRYVYCVNNPLRFVDPTGRFLNIIAAALGAAIGAAAGAIIYAAEVALTDKTWDTREFLVEVAVGAVAGAVTGLLMNPGVGMASRAGLKAAMLGGKVVERAGLTFGKTVLTKTIERSVSGALAGMAGGAISYPVKAALGACMGKEVSLSWQGFSESVLFSGFGGAVGANIGGFVGERFGRYADTVVNRLGLDSFLSEYEITGTVILQQLASKLTSKGLSGALEDLATFGNVNQVKREIPTYAFVT